MVKSKTIRLAFYLIFTALLSCQSNPINKIQGVYIVNKASLKELMQKNLDNQNAFATALLEKAIENAVVEFEIKGDSIKGIIFLAGQSNVLNSKIQVRNDSLLINTDNSDAYLIPTADGLFFKSHKSDLSIQMLKSDQNNLSTKTQEVLVNLIKRNNELKEFTKNLGMWQKGNFVDEFKDKTGQGFAYSVVLGSHENSSVVNSDVYVKTIIEEEMLYFQIFNSSMTMKENFPDSKFGNIKIKYSNGDVKTEKAFFYDNSVSEYPDDKIPLIYSHLLNNNDELKILIDLSTASEFYSDKYQFTLKKNNLDEVMSKIKN